MCDEIATKRSIDEDVNDITESVDSSSTSRIECLSGQSEHEIPFGECEKNPFRKILPSQLTHCQLARDSKLP